MTMDGRRDGADEAVVTDNIEAIERMVERGEYCAAEAELESLLSRTEREFDAYIVALLVKVHLRTHRKDTGVELARRLQQHAEGPGSALTLAAFELILHGEVDVAQSLFARFRTDDASGDLGFLLLVVDSWYEDSGPATAALDVVARTNLEQRGRWATEVSALKLINACDWKDAEARLRSRLILDEGDWRARALLLHVMYESGKRLRGSGVSGPWLDEESAPPIVSEKLVGFYWRVRDWVQVAVHARNVLFGDPWNEHARHAHAYALLKLEQFEEAELEWVDLIDSVAFDRKAADGLAAIFFLQREWQKLREMMGVAKRKGWLWPKYEFPE